MKQIGQFEFPETHEEVDEWTPIIRHVAIHRKVLLVAKTRIEGSWSCYCTTVPGENHDAEVWRWQSDGAKTSEAIARAAFPIFKDIPYAQ